MLSKITFKRIVLLFISLIVVMFAVLSVQKIEAKKTNKSVSAKSSSNVFMYSRDYLFCKNKFIYKKKNGFLVKSSLNSKGKMIKTKRLGDNFISNGKKIFLLSMKGITKLHIIKSILYIP